MLWRLMLDAAVAALLVLLVVRSAPRVSAGASWFVVAGTLGPLITYLALSSRGYRGTISFDLAYASFVVILAIRSRGDIWRYLPEKYWAASQETSLPRRLQVNILDLTIVLMAYLMLEHFVGMGILD